jgi:hypothetical protein
MLKAFTYYLNLWDSNTVLSNMEIQYQNEASRSL